MPSEYPSKQEMKSRGRASSAPGRRPEIEHQGPRRAGTQTVLSAFVQRLARDLGKDPEELAAKIDPDTIRRTKFPMIEERLPDGKLRFKHDPGIIEGAIPLIRK